MKLWGGRFEKATNPAVEDFHSSLRFDSRMVKQDVMGSIAHARMLGTQGIIPQADALRIIEGLTSVLEDIQSGRVALDVSAEDIHMNVEKLLTERIGEAGKRLHTARSRNDQVALDCRMYLKEACVQVRLQLRELQKVIVDTAEKNLDTMMPGFTHLQKAQPVSLAFHVMAYFEMLQRDYDRFGDCFDRADVMPLGSGALAGTTYDLDRQKVAAELGFSAITRNAMDGVSDRDFVLEFMSASSICMMHLSRFCEEIITWASDEYRFISLDDSYSTGSSIMPQKKNPDVAELIRGKTGRVYGDLIALLTAMKGLPLAYNKDMQEDKEAFFDAYDTLSGCLTVFTGMLSTTAFHKDVMARSAAGGFTNATDAADYLCGKGIPFREAHEIIGHMVLECVHRGLALDQLKIEELKNFSPLIENDFYQAIDLKNCVMRRNLSGGPAPSAVAEHVAAARNIMEKVSE